MGVTNNPIWQAWQKAGKEERTDMVEFLCLHYAPLLCVALKGLGRCLTMRCASPNGDGK